ncbi:MAG: hypothetical protein IPQ08_03155 [Chitinophagaceae bacterium]|nr:hypothetical protein [Chitinophagaceae bacterium]
MRTYLFIFFALVAFSWIGCKPQSATDDTNNIPYNLTYGDSIIYLRPVASGDYVVYPSTRKEGVYTGFPEGIEIDAVTGAINVSKSETGLRYRITHTALDGKKTETNLVLSGITFSDKFYNLSQNDSLCLPIYNASEARALPLSGSNFDEGNNANSGGCSVRTENGSINLAQCVRNGVFGNTPQNDSRRDFDINYRINDASGKSLNKIRVRIYYYTSMATVAPDLMQTLLDRQTGGVFLRGGTVEMAAQTAKPRPPCVIIIAN